MLDYGKKPTNVHVSEPPGGEEGNERGKKSIFILCSLTRQGLNVISRMGRFVEYSVFGREVTCDWSIISK